MQSRKKEVFRKELNVNGKKKFNQFKLGAKTISFYFIRKQLKVSVAEFRADERLYENQTENVFVNYEDSVKKRPNKKERKREYYSEIAQAISFKVKNSTAQGFFDVMPLHNVKFTSTGAQRKVNSQ